ncbi:hypothetical protein J5X84_07510 [Streptosporangiaceae bacterium NEAU-GS5]|nr:hypothetical protein [Streptosporangiaceae bacterium NEAU-GS5]
MKHANKTRVSVVAGLAALGLLVAPLAADAATTRTASGNAWGQDRTHAEANAKVMALNNLNALARANGESGCSGVSYVTYLIYQVPSGGGFQYGADATGSCA